MRSLTRAARPLTVSVLVGALMLINGCSKLSNAVDAVRPTWHQKFGWEAKKYFGDPLVIELCHAIEANDVQEIDRLVEAGADVNSKGKGNMTPLLWAFPDNKPERFKRLLELGADPNVIVESDFNTRRRGIVPGDSVTHMAAKSRFHHFHDVMQHGGDPNLLHPKYKETPLFTVIKGSGGQRAQRIQLLIDKGADLDHVNSLGSTPTMQAVGWGGQYKTALQLLKAGANPGIYRTNQNSRLIHTVVSDERRLKIASDEQNRDYWTLVKWLEDHGESVAEARKDLARWASWAEFGSLEKIKELREAEIAERLAREKAIKEASRHKDTADE